MTAHETLGSARLLDHTLLGAASVALAISGLTLVALFLRPGRDVFPFVLTMFIVLAPGVVRALRRRPEERRGGE